MKSHLLLVAACSLVLGISLLVGCGGSTKKEERTYSLHGTVVEVTGGQVKIDHEAIPGYMGAMQMTFAVSRPELLQGLKAGDHVHGQLRVDGGQPVITQLGKE